MYRSRTSTGRRRTSWKTYTHGYLLDRTIRQGIRYAHGTRRPAEDGSELEQDGELVRERHLVRQSEERGVVKLLVELLVQVLCHPAS